MTVLGLMGMLGIIQAGLRIGHNTQNAPAIWLQHIDNSDPAQRHTPATRPFAFRDDCAHDLHQWHPGARLRAPPLRAPALRYKL